MPNIPIARQDPTPNTPSDSERMSIDPIRANQLQRRLRLGAVLGILLTSALVGSLSSLILYRSHAEHLKKELLFAIELEIAALESELTRLKNNVVQITSRTRIRQELEKYNAGTLSLEALVAFTGPKLKDVMRLTPEIKGITRLDLAGEPLIQVGEVIDQSRWPVDYAGDPPRLGSVFHRGDKPFLVVSAPIINRAGSKVGVDLALFDVTRLQAIMDGFFERHRGGGRIQISSLEGSTARHFFVRGDYVGNLSETALYAEILEALIGQNAEELHQVDGTHMDQLLVHKVVAENQWVFLYLGKPRQFFSPARHQAYYIAATILGLALIGIYLTHLVMHPLAGKIMVGTNSLYQLLENNKKLLAKVKESEAEMQAIIDNAPAVIYVKNADGRYQLVNNAFEKFSGLGKKDIVGKTDHELFPAEIADQFRENDQNVMRVGHAIQSDERAPHTNGIHDYLSTKFPLRNEKNETYAICGISTDITERKQHERRLQLSAAVFENSGEGIMVTDAEGKIVDVNPAFTRIMGYRRSEVLGQNPRLLRSNRHDSHFYKLLWRSIACQGEWRGEIWNKRKDGSEVPEIVTITRILDNNYQTINYVAVYSDISSLKRSQEQLSHLAHHDALTDLPNRVLFTERVEHAIHRAKRGESQLAVIFLDLDHFKDVNDSLGHRAGDKLLTEVAELLRISLRNDDTIARIGGDEFVLLLEDIVDSNSAISIVEKILSALDHTFRVSGQTIHVTASLGVSLYPRDGGDGDTLMRNADAAMYRAKAEGRNTYRFYTEELTRQAFERMRLESNLRAAIANREFELYYQPKIDLRTQKLNGLEALIRWIHPVNGMLLPDHFIPVAEQSDLIHPMGQWIMHSACRQAKEWLDEGLLDGTMAINVSGKQIFNGDLVKDLKAVMADTGLAPEHLELEVTESFIMDETRGAVEVLRELRALGLTLTVDDFGTGYSSLSYLKSLPLQRLKIDKSFVLDIPDDPNDMAITRAVIALGKSLQLEIVAEGIETKRQLDFLVAEGCDLGQGYLYSRPLPAKELGRLLANKHWPFTSDAHSRSTLLQ